MKIDLSQTACCLAVQNDTVCNEEEVHAKGGAFPCVNPINRLGFWIKAWGEALAPFIPATQDSLFDGVVYVRSAVLREKRARARVRERREG